MRIYVNEMIVGIVQCFNTYRKGKDALTKKMANLKYGFHRGNILEECSAAEDSECQFCSCTE